MIRCVQANAPGSTQRGPRPRSLWPREHGAYAQLAVPLLAALAIAPSWPGALLAIAACGMFLAFEPVRVLAGLRGARRAAAERPRAVRRLLIVGVPALAAGVVGLVRAPSALPAIAALSGPAVLVIVLAWRRVVHTAAGEVAAAVALAGASLPVAVAGGLSLASATWMWLVWSLGYATTVVAVHTVLARHRTTARTLVTSLALGAVVVASGAVATHTSRALAIAPLALASTLAVAAGIPASRVRAIGVAFVIASVLAATWLVIVARA